MKIIKSIIGLTALKNTFIGNRESNARAKKSINRATIPSKFSILNARIPSSITATIFVLGSSLWREEIPGT
jgi:hypothetical protein